MIDVIDSNESPGTTGQPIPPEILRAAAIAGYNAGNSWPTFSPYCHARPDLARIGRVISISLTARARARALDMEKGGATIYDAPHWYRTYADWSWGKPIGYTLASQVAGFVNQMSRAGIGRGEYYVWSACVGFGRHICGDGTTRCPWPRADMTQFGQYRTYDISMAPDYVFVPFAPPKPPAPKGVLMPLTCGLNAQGDFHVFQEMPNQSIRYTFQRRSENAWNGGKEGVSPAGMGLFSPAPASLEAEPTDAPAR